MRKIVTVDFGDLCVYGDDVECVVTYEDGSTETFSEEKDIAAVMGQVHIQQPRSNNE